MRRLPPTLWVGATLLVLSLATLPLRNDTFEFCTTKAYGFPLPWWMAWCECEKGSNWPEQIVYWAVNLVTLYGVAVLIRRVSSRARRGRRPAG
jgi:hypothetical protein